MEDQEPARYLPSSLPQQGVDWYSASPGAPSAQRNNADSLDLSQLWRMVRDAKYTVFAIAGVVFALVMLMCLTSQMKFLSSARIYLGESESKTSSSNSASLDIAASQANEVGSEIEVLRSRSMVKRAVLASGLNVRITPPGWQAPRMWNWLLSKRDPKLLEESAEQVEASDTSLREDIQKPRVYRVKFLDTSNYELTQADADKPIAGKLGEPLTLQDATITLVSGRSGPKPDSVFEVVIEPVDDVVARVLESLTVATPKSSSGSSEPVRVVSLEFSSNSPRLSASFLKHLMQEYLETRHAWKTEDASAAERFVTEQLRAMQQSLDRTQEQLAEYRADNRVVVLGNEAEALAQQMNRYEEQRVAARLQVASLRNIKRALSDPSGSLETYMIGESDDAVLRQLAASLAAAHAKLSELNTSFSSAAPDVKHQKEQLDSQLTAIRNYVDGRLSRAEKNVASLDNVISEYETKLKSIPNAQLGLTRIGRETEVYSRMYSYLLERQQQAAITKASTVSKNRILDMPQVAKREDSPKLMLHVASLPLGLLLGAAIVILRGLFSSRVNHESDVRGMLGRLQIFARIPLRTLRTRHRDGESGQVAMFDLMGQEADPAYAESFRSLRTNLYRALPGEGGKVIVVTSPTPGDGKTVCVLSLAAMLAADHRRVLVIDGDIRRPSHHTLLGVPQEPGLRSVVEQEGAQVKDCVRTLGLSVGFFDAITCEPGQSAELLSSAQFAAFLSKARTRWDYIVLDAPSFPLVSDPLVLAPLADFVLSVMRLGNTTRKLAEEHLAGLFPVARGCAVVVNNAEDVMMPGSPKTKAPPRLAAALRR